MNFVSSARIRHEVSISPDTGGGVLAFDFYSFSVFNLFNGPIQKKHWLLFFLLSG